MAEAIERVRPWGVDVASGVERAPAARMRSRSAGFIANAKAVPELHSRRSCAPVRSVLCKPGGPFDWQIERD
ncbi:MAG: hypothetical protein R2749_10155 [Acidimicrobiales bacterium]